MRPNLVPLMMLLTACAADSQGPTDPNDVPYIDPYADDQDVNMPSEITEVEDLPPGTEQVVDVVIENTGPFELQLDEVRLANWSDPEWTLVEDSVPAAIDADSSVTVQVGYVAPLGRDSYAALEVRTNDPDEALAATGLLGRAAEGSPEPRLEPLVLDFGFVFQDEEERLTMDVRNDGDQSVSVLGVSIEQSASQAAFALSCPGQPVVFSQDEPPSCPLWDDLVGAGLMDTPLAPGETRTIELAFIPGSLVTNSAQIVVATSDPRRPVLTATARGNGDGGQGCTPPSITLLSPTEPTFHAANVDGRLVIDASVDDDEQPAHTLIVELYSGDLLIADETANASGAVHFDLDLDSPTEPDNPVPLGLQTLTLRVGDSCPLFAETSFVISHGDIFTGTDSDGDGWSVEAGDCDDGAASTYPGARELSDGVDQDCDGAPDNGTAAWDNDCDGYCADPDRCEGQGPSADIATCTGLAAEPVGDCDDRPFDGDGDGTSDGAAAHPGAEEVANHRDDDCDGDVDAGTAFRDDDGDGFTENGGDCDDESATVFGGALEWCDELDNDCQGGVDDGCIDEVPPPRLVGAIRVDRFEIALGTRVQTRVVVLAEDEDLSFSWDTTLGEFTGDTNMAEVTWQSPADTEENHQHLDSLPPLQASVTDSLGRTHSAFGEVHIASASGAAGQTGGCSVGGGAGSAGLLLLRFAFLRRRLALVAALALLATPALAAEEAGVTLPDTMEVAGTNLPIHGIGLRSMLMIKVYVAALYIEGKGLSAEQVISSNAAKAVVMHMKIGLDGEKVGSSIEDGFERNSAEQLPKLRTRLDKLKELFPAFSKNDQVLLAWDPTAQKTIVTAKGKQIAAIDGKDFSDALFRVWLGTDPVKKSLKEDLLGQ